MTPVDIALKNMSLESTLSQFIDEITSLEWLALKSQGAIFLVGNEAWPSGTRTDPHPAGAQMVPYIAQRVVLGKNAYVAVLSFRA